ncbi:MAG: hypothetical protein E7645_07185 [Ruminococcaceae bacterium]|nr:hypothetical protein [Oscillospiraceae bacterium]
MMYLTQDKNKIKENCTMMEHSPHLHNQDTQSTADVRRREPPDHRTRMATATRIALFFRGILLGGAAYLLGTCSLPLGAMPLGFSLLCASSEGILYVLAGLLLSVFHSAFPLPFWAGWILYLFIFLLRLLFGMLTAPEKSPSAVKSSVSAYTQLCRLTERLWQSETEAERDTVTDYYYGKRNTPAKVPEETPHTEQSEEDTSTRHLFETPMSIRLLLSSLGAFSLGLWRWFIGEFAVYNLLGFLLGMVCAPLFTYLLSFCMSHDGLELLFPSSAPDVLPRHGHTHLLTHYSLMTLVSGLLLLFLCVLGAKVHTLSLLPPYVILRLSPILALVLSLHITAHRGLIPGMMAAILCGLAADPLLSPAFILGAMFYGLLHFLSHHIALAGGCGAALIWTVFGSGVSQLVAYLPSMLISIPLFLLIRKLSLKYPVATRQTASSTANDFTAAMEQKTRAEAHRSRLEALSGAFTSLSHMFYDLSGKLRKPKLTELRRMCDEVFDRHCARCRHREECDKAVCHPADLISARLSAQLYHKGHLELSGISPEVISDCHHIRTILEDINTRYGKLTEHLIKSEKAEVFATDYESVADLIQDTLHHDEEEFRCNREAADKIFEWLESRKVSVMGVVVCGTRTCRIIVRGCYFDRSDRGLSDMRRVFEGICGTRLTSPIFESESDADGVTIMSLFSEEQLETTYAGSTVPAGTKEKDPLPTPLTNEDGHSAYLPPLTCGDHIALFKSDNACFYALISDGMGSGEEASQTSDICALFLEKMLSAGNRAELSIRMLNSFIRQKNNGTGDECSATVDLMELDLMSGQAVFAKNGAAPTYVVRGGRVYKLRSRTLPIGILKDSDPQLLRFRMHPGDVVVMVSDGVTLGNDECPWLIDLLSGPLPDSMDSLRLKILRRALASGSPDDLSAIAVRVDPRAQHTL